jgi:hypothetical protein
MEYGTQLTILSAALCKRYQAVQDAALRAIFSAPRRTSSNALHKLLRIQKFDFRNRELHIRYICKLHNSTDGSIPAVKLWWKLLIDSPDRSLVTKGIQNPLWARARRINHITASLKRERCSYIPPFDDPERKEQKAEHICQIERNTATVAGTLQVETNDEHRHALKAGTFFMKAHRIAIQRWLTGSIAWHQDCRNCDGGKLSRQHAVTCSGAEDYLRGKYGNDINNELNQTALDQLLNKYRNEPPNRIFYGHIFQAISKIYKKCMGFTLRRNGYWAQAVEDDNVSEASIETTDSEIIRRARAPPQRASDQARIRRQLAKRGTQPRRRRGPRRGIG